MPLNVLMGAFGFFENWLVAEHSMDLSTINRLDRIGGEAFRKAMELYENR